MTYWHHRSRIQWLKEGDANTVIFHKTASHHKLKNFIPSIHHSRKLIQSESNELKAFHEHFSNIFGQKHISSLHIDWTSLYPSQPPDLSQLEVPFFEEEIKSAIFGMNANKAPDPDGLSMLFYQTFWDSLKQDIVCLFEHLYYDSSSLHKLNMADIYLIPKTNDASSTNDFRPITLLNCIFKVFSKVKHKYHVIFIFRLLNYLPK